MEGSERYTRGWDKLKEIDGEAGEKVVSGLQGTSPELARFVIEYAFGDVYSLTALDNKQKEVAAVSSLVAQGGYTAVEGASERGVERRVQYHRSKGTDIANVGIRRIPQMHQRDERPARGAG